MADYTYRILEHLATLSRYQNGISLEVNIVANPTAARGGLDIREWQEDKKQMRRGITLNKEETYALISTLLSHQNLLEALESEEDNYDKSTD